MASNITYKPTVQGVVKKYNYHAQWSKCTFHAKSGPSIFAKYDSCGQGPHVEIRMLYALPEKPKTVFLGKPSSGRDDSGQNEASGSGRAPSRELVINNVEVSVMELCRAAVKNLVKLQDRFEQERSSGPVEARRKIDALCIHGTVARTVGNVAHVNNELLKNHLAYDTTVSCATTNAMILSIDLARDNLAAIVSITEGGKDPANQLEKMSTLLNRPPDRDYIFNEDGELVPLDMQKYLKSQNIVSCAVVDHFKF